LRSITVTGRRPDPVLSELIARCASVVYVDALADLGPVLDQLAARSAGGPCALDLVGHSTGPAHLLRLGDTIIDPIDPVVDRWFREVARDHLPARVGVVALRLIGCQTAVASASRRTLQRLADAVGLPVFGTTKLLTRSHFNDGGFDPIFHHILAAAQPVRRRAVCGR
jgi:hypothetical protein